MGYASGVGRQAPAFSATTLDGQTIDLKRYRGDWFPILVFLPANLAQRADYVDRLDDAAAEFWGLRGQLIVICQADQEQPRSPEWAPALTLPVIADERRLAAAYGATCSSGEWRPTACIVDRAGKIVWTGSGRRALDPEVLVSAFREAVR